MWMTVHGREVGILSKNKSKTIQKKIDKFNKTLKNVPKESKQGTNKSQKGEKFKIET